MAGRGKAAGRQEAVQEAVAGQTAALSIERKITRGLEGDASAKCKASVLGGQIPIVVPSTGYISLPGSDWLCERH